MTRYALLALTFITFATACGRRGADGDRIYSVIVDRSGVVYGAEGDTDYPCLPELPNIELIARSDAQTNGFDYVELQRPTYEGDAWIKLSNFVPKAADGALLTFRCSDEEDGSFEDGTIELSLTREASIDLTLDRPLGNPAVIRSAGREVSCAGPVPYIVGIARGIDTEILGEGNCSVSCGDASTSSCETVLRTPMADTSCRLDVAEEDQVQIEIELDVDGWADGGSPGTIRSEQVPVTCRDRQCSASAVRGQALTLVATPASDYSFAGWGGDCESFETSVEIVAQSSLSCVARFVERAPECVPPEIELRMQVIDPSGTVVEPNSKNILALGYETYRFDASSTLSSDDALFFSWTIVSDGGLDPIRGHGRVFEHTFTFLGSRPGQIELEVRGCDGTTERAVYPFVLDR